MNFLVFHHVKIHWYVWHSECIFLFMPGYSFELRASPMLGKCSITELHLSLYAQFWRIIYYAFGKYWSIDFWDLPHVSLHTLKETVVINLIRKIFRYWEAVKVTVVDTALSKPLLHFIIGNKCCHCFPCPDRHTVFIFKKMSAKHPRLNHYSLFLIILVRMWLQ
jgi:hypothetical protein